MNELRNFSAAVAAIGTMALTPAVSAQERFEDVFVLATIPRPESPRNAAVWVVIQPVKDRIPMDRAPVGFRVDTSGNATERICGPVIVDSGHAYVIIEKTQWVVWTTLESLSSPCPEPPTDAVVHRIDITENPR